MPLRFPFRRRGGEPLKRRLLAGAIDDNLRAIRNQPRGQLHRRRSLSPRIALAAAAFAFVAAGAWWMRRLPVPRISASPAVSAPPTLLAPAVAASMTGLAAAEPAIDVAIGPPARISPSVLPLAVRRVVLDPGHGGGDQGARTKSGLLEKDLTLDIAQRVARLLAASGYDVVLTRTTDRRVSLRERAQLANGDQADLFVSIHVNWFEDGRKNLGVETYYLGPSDDPSISALAAAENQESGYSLADARRLLDSIYADLRQEQSRALATAVQRRLVRSERELSPETADRGVKSAPFLVLVSAEMPAILAEVASLSNSDEARLLAEEDYRQRIAVALEEGIRSYSEAVARPYPALETR